MVSILSTEQVSHSFSDNWLFSSLNFGIAKGERIALVGANGSGKSTLLKILASVIEPTSGIVVGEKGITIGFLPQEPSFEGVDTINDFIYSTDNRAQYLIGQFEQLTAEDTPDQATLEKISNEITALNAWEYEHLIKTTLTRLHISDFTQRIDTLSGGQRKRLALAKLLIDEPDVYILDEPTNHLDIETIEWLEKILVTGNKTVLLVSHDRYFLDAVCSEIRELDRGNVYHYHGNYAYFLEKKAEREELNDVVAEKSRNLLRKELEWMRRQPKARGTKSKSRIAAFYDLEEKAKRVDRRKSIQLESLSTRQGNKIIELSNISKEFDGRTVIDNFTYTFKKGDRIGLSGRNGSGKSTFLNLITQLFPPNSGTVEVGETTVFGYYKQGGLDFNESDRVIDVVKNVAEYITIGKETTVTASQLLTNFLFPPPKQFGLVSKLSGGEKKRLQLMRVLMRNPNVLILDEPTNDLDLDTLNVLEEYLENYTGVLILVSHDRYLVDRLTEQLFIFDGTGNIAIHNGNYADYKADQEALETARKDVNKFDRSIEIEKSKPAKASYKERLEFDFLGEEIAAIESTIARETERINDTVDPTEIVEIAENLARLNKDLAEKSDRWLTLSELV